MAYDNSRLNPEVGLLQRGSIDSYDPNTDTLTVLLNTSSLPKPSSATKIKIPAPHSLFYNNGLYMGSFPVQGTPVVVGQSEGGAWHFVSFVAEDTTKVPSLSLGQLLLQANDATKLALDLQNNIQIGSDVNYIHIQTGNKNTPKTNLITLNFQDENHINQGYREFGGIVKRDVGFNIYTNPDSKLEDDSIDSKYKPIGLDPQATANDTISGSSKNPPFVERREIVYEFQYKSDVRDDLYEVSRYSGTVSPKTYTRPNRRKSRADTLSLSLVSPNYLLETVKGTVVDIFGNILDLNRNKLMGAIGTNPLGFSQNTDIATSYQKMRALERKSVAYHFEINARKDLSVQTGTSTAALLDYNSDTYNAKLLRSRFFFDVDKEGQFKLNVPASSETGNIPLPVRYENYSTVSTNDSNNPDQLWFRNDGLDILLDSIAAPRVSPGDGAFSSTGHGSISLKDDSGDAGPLDRISSTSSSPVHIKHGTVHHDILNTCYMHQSNDRIGYVLGTNTTPWDISYIVPLSKVVSDTIRLGGSGPPDQGGPNAGGRSGAINMDGSLELNIGANTIDRQSLWLDTAGGIVANIGRDRQNNSAIVGMDGNLYIQVGGFTVSGDTRFVGSNGEMGAPGTPAAVLDLRVATGGGTVAMLRIDSKGVTVMSPQDLNIIAKNNIRIQADSHIEIEADNVTIQQRVVTKIQGGSI